jgi:hypothetical protein
MADTLLLHTLRRKRAYLQGEIEAKECQLGCLRDDLETIDRMIRLVDAGTDPNTIKGIRPAQRLEGFKQGDHTKLCFAILREAGEPLTAPQIARQVAERKSVAFGAELVIRVRANVMRLAREGRLQKSGVRRALKWGLPDR